MPHNDYWPASFEVISTPPKKFWYLHTKLFCGQKNQNSGGGTAVAPAEFEAKTAFFFRHFFVTPISTLATTSDPSRLIRPRPVDRDSGHDRQIKIFRPFFGKAQAEAEAPKEVAVRARYQVTICTPKGAHSRIFVTGWSFYARQKVAKKSSSHLGRRACTHFFAFFSDQSQNAKVLFPIYAAQLWPLGLDPCRRHSGTSTPRINPKKLPTCETPICASISASDVAPNSSQPSLVRIAVSRFRWLFWSVRGCWSG